MGEPSPPFLLLARTTAEGVRYNILGQLFGRDTLLITRTIREVRVLVYSTKSAHVLYGGQDALLITRTVREVRSACLLD